MGWSKYSIRFLTGVMCFILLSLSMSIVALGETEDIVIRSIAWSPDGSMIATGHHKGIVRVWDAETTTTLYEFEVGTWTVHAVAWNPEGTQITGGSYDGVIHIWDVTDGELVLALQPHRREIFALTWSLDGTKIIAGTPEQITLHVWDARSGEFLGDHWSRGAIHLSWNSDGTRLATANPGGSAQVLDGTTFEILEHFSIPRVDEQLGGQGRDVYVVQWDPTDTLVAIGSLNGVVRVWNPISGDILHEFIGHDEQIIDSFQSAIRNLRFSDDGLILTSVSANGVIRSWDISNGERILDMNLREYISAAAWSPDGTQLAYGIRESPDSLEGSLRIMVLSSRQAE